MTASTLETVLVNGYSELTPFQAIDAEKALVLIETARKNMLREVTALWQLLQDSAEADALNRLAEALEDTDLLDTLWDGVKAQQEALEEAEQAELYA